MSRELLSGIAIALLVATVTHGPARARCSCLDTVDDVKRQMEEQAALMRLPSEASRSLARQFCRQKLYVDAKQYYDLAVKQVKEETASDILSSGLTPAGTEERGLTPAATMSATFSGRLEQALEVDREAADFATMRGDQLSAAALREQALDLARRLHENVDLVQEYSSLASMFEAAGNKGKAAGYYKKLAEFLASTHGRYDRETIAAWGNYRRVGGL